ncbi:MAG TPA: hypothetical protein VIX86_10795 [Streptosporangiaceae bacterium]
MTVAEQQGGQPGQVPQGQPPQERSSRLSLQDLQPGESSQPREGVRGGWLAGKLAVVRRHWPAAVLLAAGLVLRVLAELAYRPALFYIDTTRYLYNADGMDPVGYKGPLRAILLVGNFDAVAAVQHLLALAMAVVLYLLVLRRSGSRWLAALAIAPLLLDAYQIQTEQSIMPGTWFEALIVAGLAILLWQQRPGWRRVVLAGVVLGTSATFAQVGEVLVIPAVLYLLVAGARGGAGSLAAADAGADPEADSAAVTAAGGRAGGWWRRAGGKAAALVVAFALPILAYSTGSYLMTGDFFLSHSGVTSFYGRMAAAADCTTLRLSAGERGMCPAPAQQAMGPDWLEYGPGSPIRPYYAHLPRATTDRLISDFNRRVLTQQPLRVAGAYSRDVLKPFALTRDTGPGDAPISRWQFQTSFPYYPPHASTQVVRTAVAQFGGGAPAVWQPVARFLRAYQLDGGYTPGPLLLVFTVAGLAGSLALLRRRTRADPVASQPALACLLFFGCGVALLLASDLFEFSWRYQLLALITLTPAGVLGIGVILSRLRQPPATGSSPVQQIQE